MVPGRRRICPALGETLCTFSNDFYFNIYPTHHDGDKLQNVRTILQMVRTNKPNHKHVSQESSKLFEQIQDYRL